MHYRQKQVDECYKDQTIMQIHLIIFHCYFRTRLWRSHEKFLLTYGNSSFLPKILMHLETTSLAKFRFNNLHCLSSFHATYYDTTSQPGSAWPGCKWRAHPNWVFQGHPMCEMRNWVLRTRRSEAFTTLILLLQAFFKKV